MYKKEGMSCPQNANSKVPFPTLHFPHKATETPENQNALQFLNPNSQSPLSLLSKNGLQIPRRTTMRYAGNGRRKHRVQEETVAAR